MMKRFTISCDEATTICDKNQYKEASFLDLLRLNIHFLSCKICRMYTKQNTFISALIKGNKESLCKQKTNHFTEEEKEVLKRKLKNQATE